MVPRGSGDVRCLVRRKVDRPSHCLSAARSGLGQRRPLGGRLRKPMREQLSMAAPKRTRPFLTGAAIIVAVAALGLPATTYFSHPGGETYTTPVGGHEVVTLADEVRKSGISGHRYGKSALKMKAMFAVPRAGCGAEAFSRSSMTRSASVPFLARRSRRAHR